MAGKVTLQTTLGKPNVPVTQNEQLAYVLLEVKPTSAMANIQVPLNLSLVLDHSGSMQGEKLQYLKEAVKLVLDGLQPQDYVALSIFDEEATLIAPSQPLTNPDHLKSLVDGIQERGGTAMSQGMRLGIQEVQKALDPSRVSRILVLTDGQTFGDEEICEQLATEAGQLGIPMTALGLGDDWNSELLDTMAQASGGTSDFIDNPDKIKQHFQSTVTSMQATVVTNAQLTLRLVRGVKPKKVWRVVPVIGELTQKVLSERDVQLHLGELEKDQGQAIIVEMLLPPRIEGRYRIAQAEVTYDVPSDNRVGEKVRHDVVMSYSNDPAMLKQYDTRVMNLIEKVTAFKLQTRALDEAKVGNVTGATQKLRAVATRLLDLGESDLAEAATQEAQRLEQGQGLSSAGTKKLQYATRKLTQNPDDMLPES